MKKAYNTIGKAIAILNEYSYTISGENVSKEEQKTYKALRKQIECLNEIQDKYKSAIIPKNAMTYSEFSQIMSEHGYDRKPIYGVIVYKANNWTKNYSLASRSYAVSSNNKVFQSGAGGYSLFGSALDGSDDCVRLERIIWTIEYCYITSNLSSL